MRRDKAVTRILLILSVVRAAAAAPAIIRQRSLEVTKDVTPALEKRANSDEEWSHTFPPMNDILPTTSGTVLSRDDTPPAPGDPQLHSDLSPELGNPQLNIDQPPTPGTPQLHNDLPPTPGAPPSQEDPLPVSGIPQLHNGQPPTSQGDMSSASEDPQVHDDPSPWQQHANLGPPGEMLRGESSVVPQLDDDPWSDMHHYDWLPPWEVLRGEVSTAPLFPDALWRYQANHNVQFLQEMAYVHRVVHEGSPGVSVASSEAPELQNDPPAAPGSPQVHDEGASSSSDFDSEAPPLHSETPQPLESEALPSAPETHTFFNDAMKQKLKVFAGVGAVAGVLVGLGLGVNKLIKDHSHKSQPAVRGLASGSVVIRG